MRIDYKILWFEDEKKWYESTSEFIKEFLEEKGFNMTVNWQENGDNIAELIADNDFDIILVDYNLSSSHGDYLIKKIRDNHLYTEIVFYSQAGENEIRKIIGEKCIDGVYCASRDINDFEDKVNNVIETTIKKVEEISNMRGLVMSETSELDSMLEELIKRIFNANDCKSEEWLEEIRNKTIKSKEDKVKKIRERGCISDLVCDLDAYDKYRTVVRLLKQASIDIKDEQIVFNTYNDEVIKIRNVLAHVYEDKDEQGKKILKSKIKGYESIHLNEDKFIEIRKNLVKHIDNISSLLDKV